ncbi:MAG TPA: hypothetical protein VFB06_36825 [Streptosporangiaceae bacterium]|nr:hypothetical protein [Streptosporangiaceae bacterium]
MSQNIRPGASAEGQPADSTGTSRDRINEPPAMVNHLPVIAWRPRPARQGELPSQFYVICMRRLIAAPLSDRYPELVNLSVHIELGAAPTSRADTPAPTRRSVAR